MTVQQHQYSREEIAQRGEALYQSQIRTQVEPGNHGNIVAIDVETAAFEVGRNSLAASDKLLVHHPDAQIWFVRIGHLAVHRIGHSSVPISE
jgi:mannose-6-phosphate isomerase-like protein (cupin superfamily)